MFKLKHILIPILFLFAFTTNTQASNTKDNEPTVVINSTVSDPGELLLQIDALNFTGDNGQVAAITLHIEIDTLLVEFVNIQNTTIAGNWLGNYNTFQNDITITYTAPFGTGNDINGKLLDLGLIYFGGFTADLHFKATCEISNVNLQTIPDVVYLDGSVSQTAAVGSVFQDTAEVANNEPFIMPIMAVGTGYNMVNKVDFRIGYDTTQMEYNGFSESLLPNITVVKTDSILTINWEDTQSFVDLTTTDTLVNLHFNFTGNNNQTIPFLPGSKVTNDDIIVATDFIDGLVKVKLLVELINNPDTAGTATGGGYYFIDDIVTVTAFPEDGFQFINWTKNGTIVSTNPVYSYTKQGLNDTLTANYQGNPHNLSLVALPSYGGEVNGEGTYLYGETVSVIAIPNDGYEFTQWMFGGDIISYDSQYIFVMPDSDMELIAVFDTLLYNIDVAPNNINFGTVAGGGFYNFWETAVVTATPLPLYKFVVWTENGQAVSTQSEYSFPVNSNRNLVAEFQLDTECSAPVSLYADNLSETEAELNWLPSGNENEWDILWGETGFDTINEGTLIEGITELYYLLENLNPGTSYDFYARAVCSSQLHSSWAGPHTFSTWFVGLNNQLNSNFVKLFPNPTNNILNIEINGLFSSKKNYRIANMIGEVVMEGELIKKVSSVNVDALPGGIYIIQIFTNNIFISKYLVKN